MALVVMIGKLTATRENGLSESCGQTNFIDRAIPGAKLLINNSILRQRSETARFLASISFSLIESKGNDEEHPYCNSGDAGRGAIGTGFGAAGFEASAERRCVEESCAYGILL